LAYVTRVAPGPRRRPHRTIAWLPVTCWVGGWFKKKVCSVFFCCSVCVGCVSALPQNWLRFRSSTKNLCSPQDERGLIRPVTWNETELFRTTASNFLGSDRILSRLNHGNIDTEGIAELVAPCFFSLRSSLLMALQLSSCCLTSGETTIHSSKSQPNSFSR
jgi:hypothetical protein